MKREREPRRTPLARPADERASDQSTPESGGLHEDLRGVRPGPGPELARERDADDVLERNADHRYETPRRYDDPKGEEKKDRDPAMPGNDSTSNTKI